MLSINLKPLVIGVMLNDEIVCNVSLNTNSIKKNYIDDEYLKFIPSMFISLQDKSNNNNNNTINYNSKIRKLNFHMDTTFILNYTDAPIYVKNKNNVPIKIDMMKDCINLEKYNVNTRDIDIISIQTIHNPYATLSNTFSNNSQSNWIEIKNKFIESLVESYKQNNEEATAIYEYMIKNVKQLSSTIKNINTHESIMNNYLKVIVLHRVLAYDIDTKSTNKTIYVENKDLLISRKNFTDIQDHPFINNKSILMANTQKINNSTKSVYIIDSDNILARKFYKLLDRVLEIPVIHMNKPNGLYVESWDGEKIINNVIDINDVNSLTYIYNSVEEAEKGSNIETVRKTELVNKEFELAMLNKNNDINKLSIELEKIKEQNNLALLNNELNTEKARQEKIKLDNEYQILMAKKDSELEKARLDFEKNKREIEKINYTAPIEKDLYERKNKNEKNKHKLDKLIAELKLNEIQKDKELTTYKTLAVVIPISLGLIYKAVDMYQKR